MLLLLLLLSLLQRLMLSLLKILLGGFCHHLSPDALGTGGCAGGPRLLFLIHHHAYLACVHVRWEVSRFLPLCSDLMTMNRKCRRGRIHSFTHPIISHLIISHMTSFHTLLIISQVSPLFVVAEILHLPHNHHISSSSSSSSSETRAVKGAF